LLIDPWLNGFLFNSLYLLPVALRSLTLVAQYGYKHIA
jgi:hypothetical protein